MAATGKQRDRRQGSVQQHGLSVGVATIVLAWLMLYLRWDEHTHLGAFFGNATADWLGTLVIVIATKYLYEIGSAESRPPHPTSRAPLLRFLIDHSLTIALVVTLAIWSIGYSRMDPNGKAGQVVGNIVSEWTQVLGLVVMTKYLRESGSKESL